MTEILLKRRKMMYNHTILYTVVYLLVYKIWFDLLEIYTEPEIIIHSRLDDMIPFRRGFVIPYLLWFVYIGVTFGWMYFREREEYINMAQYVFTGCILALIIYTFVPAGLNLRPVYTGDTLCGKLCALVYACDTPTNVCPSLHVFVSVAMLNIIKRCESLKEKEQIQAGARVLTILIIASTMFIKQHSVIDVLCGLLMSVILYPLSESPQKIIDTVRKIKNIIMNYIYQK